MSLNKKITKKIKVSVDLRGITKVPRLCKEYLDEHPRIAKNIELEFCNNQKIDAVKWDGDQPLQFFELKLGADLDNSLNNGQLEKELNEYTNLSLLYKQKPQIYVICGGEYEPIIYARLNSLMNKFSWVRLHIPLSPKKCIEKMFFLMRNPPDYQFKFTPTLITSGVERGFALSIHSLINGVSIGLAMHLADSWDRFITLDDVKALVEEYYDDGKTRNKLSERIMNIVKDTWYKKKEIECVLL